LILLDRLERIMAQRQIGQDSFHFGAKTGRQTSLDELPALLDWPLAELVLAGLYASAKGEKAWPPLAMFKALLLATGSRSFRRAACRSEPLTRAIFARSEKRKSRDGRGARRPGGENSASGILGGELPALLRLCRRRSNASVKILRKGHRWLSPKKFLARNRKLAPIRARIEKIFGTWKRSYRFRAMRWVGLAKARCQIHLAVIAYNFKRYWRLQAG
jgi:hypothetical protein